MLTNQQSGGIRTDPQERVVIGLLTHEEVGQFQEFIRNHWAQNHLFAADRSVLDWQHRGPDAYHYMVARQGGALVGVQGVIPQSHFDDALPSRHIFLTLWRALETAGIGIGLRLYKSILREYSPDFIGSIGLTPSAQPFHEWQGFQVGVMDHHVALCPDVREFNIARVPQLAEQPSSDTTTSISVQKLAEEDLEALDSEGLYSHQWPLKSNRYLANRFLNHPVYKYDVYAVSSEGATRALCVIRPISQDGSVVLRLVDFIGPNEAIPLLKGFLAEILKAHGAEYADLYSHGIPAVLLRRAGFIDRRKTAGLVVPNHFEPFERQNEDLLFAFKSSQPQCAVRLFKADGDQDRPNQMVRSSRGDRSDYE